LLATIYNYTKDARTHECRATVLLGPLNYVHDYG